MHVEKRAQIVADDDEVHALRHVHVIVANALLPYRLAQREARRQRPDRHDVERSLDVGLLRRQRRNSLDLGRLGRDHRRYEGDQTADRKQANAHELFFAERHRHPAGRVNPYSGSPRTQHTLSVGGLTEHLCRLSQLMFRDEQKALIRALIYPIQFEHDPRDGIDRVLDIIVGGRALGAEQRRLRGCSRCRVEQRRTASGPYPAAASRSDDPSLPHRTPAAPRRPAVPGSVVAESAAATRPRIGGSRDMRVARAKR